MITTITYGGQTLSKATGNGTTTGKMHTWLYFLKDNAVINVKVRLNRAKTILRKEIEKAYTAEYIFEFNLKYCDAMVSRVMNNLKNIKIE